ncbi:hypothetical protein CCHL11_02429 [Colletotrichum chlorophyti]|uniref:Uncharacterized protein n=1 Tax=Colletotrichum chlorophyti TaxID=708187 RepID=A0A1Q8S5P2_9PEZI|nr:hypothetical protein CCHL11_02429 [Colletotrichum chlorophyti]
MCSSGSPGRCSAGDANGPTGTGSEASGCRGGHKDQTGQASIRGGRQGGGGYGHHAGSSKK